MIRREQFGSRGIFDNPVYLPGAGNPGRNATILTQQFINYFQYCSWQWARSLPLVGMVAVALVFTSLGFFGVTYARRSDAGITYLLGTVWLVTGFGLVIYMNFKPGFSLFWNQYQSIGQHEVRERDYFFVVSFQVWGVFAAFGLVRLIRWASRQYAVAARRGAVALATVIALLPFVFNFRAASRRHGGDATMARDVAYNLLQAVEPYGVLFSYGDNDTFPVWYLQEVEGVRQDVTLINLSLANLEWYLRQLASLPLRSFDPAHAPPIYRSLAPPVPPSRPALPLTLADIATLQPFRPAEDQVFQSGPFALPIKKGQVLRTSDQVILYTIAANLGKRAVTFGVSSGRGSWLGLDPHVVFQGLVFKVSPRADTVRQWIRGIQGTMVDTARTRYLTDSVFQFGKLFSVDTIELDPASQQVATSFSVPFLELGNAAAIRGDSATALAYLRRGYHLNPSPQLAEIMRNLFRR